MRRQSSTARPAFSLASYGLVCLFMGWTACASTLNESFAGDPLAHGWRRSGNANLFHWNPTNQNLEVTWDSSQPNSYFYRPLGTILTPQDDFSFSFDITLLDEVNSNDFEICIGLLNAVNATATNFFRATGRDSPNLIEFAYFPAFSFFEPTMSEVVVSTNSQFLYNHTNLLEMVAGEVFHVQMSYSSTNRQLLTVITNNAQLYGDPAIINVPANFEFRVASFSVSSYSNQKAFGSILAHGIVDNMTATTPSPPLQQFVSALTNNAWQAQFFSQSNWLYTLERSTDLAAWLSVNSLMSSGGLVLMQDSNMPPGKAFYRIRAERP